MVGGWSEAAGKIFAGVIGGGLPRPPTNQMNGENKATTTKNRYRKRHKWSQKVNHIVFLCSQELHVLSSTTEQSTEVIVK